MRIFDWLRQHARPMRPEEVTDNLEHADQRQLPGIKAYLLSVQRAHDDKVGGGTFPWVAVFALVQAILASGGNMGAIQAALQAFFGGLVPVPAPPAPPKAKVEDTEAPLPPKK